MKLGQVWNVRRIFKRAKYPTIQIATHPLMESEFISTYPYDSCTSGIPIVKLYAKNIESPLCITCWHPSLEDLIADDYELVEERADNFWKR